MMLPAAQEVIRKAIASSTINTYINVLKPFELFCESQSVSLLSATDVDFMNYAQKFACPSFSFSTIRVLYSAAKFIFESHHPGQVYLTPVLQKFLKGAARVCKVPKRSLFVWDPLVVLECIEQRDRPNKVNRLASEAAVLLALASGIRASDINRLSCSVQIFDAAKKELFIPFIECQKAQNRPGVVISRYSVERSCPVSAILKYLEATKELRTDQFLFVSSHTGARCAPATIKRWLLEELRLAGVDGAPPGSTRSASASSAFASNMSFDAIAGLAGWRHEHTFQQHYHRKIIPRATSLLPEPRPIEPIASNDEAYVFAENVFEEVDFGSDNE
jgi:integrase